MHVRLQPRVDLPIITWQAMLHDGVNQLVRETGSVGVQNQET